MLTSQFSHYFLRPSTITPFYETFAIHISSVTFGVRKQLQAEQGMEDLEIQVKDLSAKKANLDKQRQDLLSKVDVMEKRNTEQRIYTQKKRKEEIAFMQYQGEHFNSFLKTIQAAAKP